MIWLCYLRGIASSDVRLGVIGVDPPGGAASGAGHPRMLCPGGYGLLQLERTLGRSNINLFILVENNRVGSVRHISIINMRNIIMLRKHVYRLNGFGQKVPYLG